jgi:hypothetical protein
MYGGRPEPDLTRPDVSPLCILYGAGSECFTSVNWQLSSFCGPCNGVYALCWSETRGIGGIWRVENVPSDEAEWY